MVKPILDLVNHHLKIIVSPIPRYLCTRCCLDTDHVSNLEEDSYQSNQEEAIHACRKHLKDFAFRQGVRNLSWSSPHGRAWLHGYCWYDTRSYQAVWRNGPGYQRRRWQRRRRQQQSAPLWSSPWQHQIPSRWEGEPVQLNPSEWIWKEQRHHLAAPPPASGKGKRMGRPHPALSSPPTNTFRQIWKKMLTIALLIVHN